MTELSGAELDAAVARLEGVDVRIESYMTNPPRPIACWRWLGDRPDFAAGPYSPSTDWVLGGPIIEREHINLVFIGGKDWGAVIPFRYAYAGTDDPSPRGSGKSPLEAAMRCYVASKATSASSPTRTHEGLAR